MLVHIKSGITKIEGISGYYIKITFNNGIKITAWNVNKYYAWFSKGTIIFSDQTKYTWHEAMPKKSTMYKLIKALKKCQL